MTDPTLIGDIITGGAIIAGALIAWGTLRGTVNTLGKSFTELSERTEAQFDDVKVELKKLGDVMVMMAESKGRMERMDDRAILQGGRIDENSKQINALKDQVTELRIQIVGLLQSSAVP